MISPTVDGVLSVIVLVQASYVKSLVGHCLPYNHDLVLKNIQLGPAGVSVNTKSVCAAVAVNSS